MGSERAGQLTVIQYPAVELRTSPHIKSSLTTESIMFNVAVALLPVCVFAVYAFGLSALLLLGVSVASCVLTEHVVCVVQGRKSTVTDWSAVVTGLLLALVLPPALPLWMAALGGILSIGLGKALFGGLGFNLFNPALVGRAFLQGNFAMAMTQWTPPFAADRFTALIPSTLAFPLASPNWDAVKQYATARAVDGWSGATPLAVMKFEFGSATYNAIGLGDLFLGRVAGSLGETCVPLILLGGIYLVARRMMDWRIPVSIFLAAFLFDLIFYAYDPSHFPSPWFILFSGGLMLGAVYMATDMVTSPTTPLGLWIYGILIGVLTVIIRLKGGLPEGVMYAILLGNAATPIINNLTQPRIYGARKREQQSNA